MKASTAEEKRDGWTAENLDAYLRGVFNGNSYNYQREILSRWRETERLASERIARFKREHDLGDPSEKRDFERMQVELANIAAMVNLAADRLENF